LWWFATMVEGAVKGWQEERGATGICGRGGILRLGTERKPGEGSVGLLRQLLERFGVTNHGEYAPSNKCEPDKK
jgi:hypothetical protein